MPHATFDSPDLSTFARLGELGLIAVGQRLSAQRAVLECRLTDPDPWCMVCGARATSRGTITRSVAHAPFGHRPTTLLIRVRRYRCDHCGNHWREDTTAAAPERAKLEESWNPSDRCFPRSVAPSATRPTFTDGSVKAFDHEDVALEWATPYVFRRTYATNHLLNGQSPIAVAALLGHTDPAFTLKTYGDWKSTPDIAGTVLEGLFSVSADTKAVTKAVTEG